MAVRRPLLALLCVSVISSSSQNLLPALDLTLLESTEPGCAADFAALRGGLDNGQIWAQTIVDASVKSPVGLFTQTTIQFGDFDECLTLPEDSPVSSQFCLVNVTPAGNTSQLLWSLTRWGICVPASCSSSGLQSTLQKYMDKREAWVSVEVLPAACTTKETGSSSLTAADGVFIAVVVTAVVIVCAATVYDMITRLDYDRVSPPSSVSQCLSARQGWYSLLRSEQPVLGVDLSPLYGLHGFAFFFILMGHRFGTHFMIMHVTNYRSVEHMFIDSWFSIWAGHMDLFVDIFFFMSAFLVSILYYAQLHKRYVSPFKVYFYRLCRLLPLYAVVVFFYATVLRQLGNGPIWNMFMDVEQHACQQNWWTNLLFINTYVNTDNMCLLQSWYIACDFQLFVVATLLVFLLQRQERLGLFVIAVVFVASTLAAFFGTYLYDRAPTMLFFKDFWTNPRRHDLFTTVYSQGHYRGTSYIMGLLGGCYAYQHRNQPFNKRWTWTLQLAGSICCLLVYWSGSLFHNRTQAHSRVLDAVYAATFHSVFGLGLVLLIVASSVGHTTFLTRIFSWQGFIPLSKLSYCVYLVHNIFQFLWIASSRTPAYLNILELVSWSIADLVISLGVSLVLCLTIETPVRYLVKYLVSGSLSTVMPQTVQAQEKYVTQDTTDLEKG